MFSKVLNLVKNKFDKQRVCDVVIIGSGLAGLSAACEIGINSKNTSVLLLDKEKNVGGNSVKASSGMKNFLILVGINAAVTYLQKRKGILDKKEFFKEDIMKSAQGFNQESLADILVNNSCDAIDFLNNVEAEISEIAQLGGHSMSRTHRPVKLPSGFAFVSKLNAALEENYKNIQIRNSQKIEEIIVKNEKVVIKGKKFEVMAKAVIIATGGFCCDKNEDSLMKEFAPHLEKIPTTNGNFATGDGMKMARSLGADLTGMSYVQLHPTGFIDRADPSSTTKFLAPEILRGSGAILLNENGERFCNELGLRDYITDEIFKNCKDSRALVFLNEEMATIFGPTLEFYLKKKLIRTYESFDSIFEDYPYIPKEKLKKTLQDYNKSIEKKVDSFGKTVFPAKFKLEDKFYIGDVTPCLHNTMGGIKINEKTQVLTRDNKVIQGLFAAGEVTGGIHGKNRLAGNSLLDCVVFGRIAGKEALNYIQN